MKRTSVLLMIFVCLGVSVTAQRAKLKLDYSVALPMGSLKDAVDKPSFNGFNAAVMFDINEKFSAGLGTGFQDFYQKYPRAVYKLSDGSDISAVMSNSIQVMPILAKAQYNFAPGKTVQPFVGAGVGGNFVMYRQYLGEFSDSKTKFGFAAVPEAGFTIPFGRYKTSGFNASVGYNYMPFKYNGLENLNSVAIRAGVHFSLR